MKEERVIKLRESVNWIADNFKDIATGRPGEFKKIIRVQPISDTGAIAIYQKESTGKQALAFFLWLDREDRFKWWFPSDSDFLFLSRAQSYREMVEAFNLGVIAKKDNGQ